MCVCCCTRLQPLEVQDVGVVRSRLGTAGTARSFFLTFLLQRLSLPPVVYRYNGRHCPGFQICHSGGSLGHRPPPPPLPPKRNATWNDASSRPPSLPTHVRSAQNQTEMRSRGAAAPLHHKASAVSDRTHTSTQHIQMGGLEVPTGKPTPPLSPPPSILAGLGSSKGRGRVGGRGTPAYPSATPSVPFRSRRSIRPPPTPRLCLPEGGIFCGVEFLLNKSCAKFLCAICSVFLRICTAVH